MRGVVTTFSVEEELKRQPLINADLYEKASNWGQKSDILRMELLLRYGGVRPVLPPPPPLSEQMSALSASKCRAMPRESARACSLLERRFVNATATDLGRSVPRQE